MNKFAIFSCVDLERSEGTGYKGPAVVLVNTSDSDNMLFFPIAKDQSHIIKKAIESDISYDADMSVLGIYKTMLDSWKAGDRFLSGILIETIAKNKDNDEDEDNGEDEEDEEDDDGNESEVPLIRLIISDSNGMIDSLVRVNFIHAILLAALLGMEIIISDRVLEQMMPGSDDINNSVMKKIKSKSDVFPEDKNIIGIAKQIMQGKIKDDIDKQDKQDKQDKKDKK
jgi:hypothetical protein